MRILESARASFRQRLLAGIAAAGFAILMLAGWSFTDAPSQEDLLTRRDVGLHLARGFKQARCAAELPPDLNPALDADLGTMIASGYMGVFPDGTFRPDATMRIGEVLAVWARLWKARSGESTPSGGNAVSRAGVNHCWRWAAEHLSLLAEADTDAAEAVAALSPDTPASRAFWRYVPLPGARQAPTSVAGAAPEPAKSCDLRTTGLVVDAVTGKPIPGAVGTIDGMAFSTDARGMFLIPGGASDRIRDVFVAVDGYRSLSIRWNPGLRPELKLSLKQFRAPLDIRVLTAKGEPVSGVSVSLPDMPGSLTDGDGMVRLRSVRPGYHHLRVAVPEMDAASMLISVAETGGVHTVRLPASSAF